MKKELRTSEPESLSPSLFKTLVAQARRHEEEALATLYRRALPVVYRYVLARLGGEQGADDVVAEVFLEMVERIGDLRAEHEAGFYAWIFRVAQVKVARAIQTLARGRVRQVPLSSGMDDDADELPVQDHLSDPAAIHELNETLRELGIALQTLTPEQQTVVVGRFLAGWSIEDLATALHKQPGAIRGLQFRALDALAEQLGLTRERRRKGGRP